MDFFSILSMLGGLALFLFGMNMLGEGLSKLFGGRFEIILIQRLLLQRFKV